MDDGVNTLQSVSEVPVNEIINDNDVHAISVLGVRSFHGVGFA